jgi:hypothetical protein
MATIGDTDLRAENFERMVKGFAMQEFKMKDLVMISTSNAWIETYYQESATELTGGLGSAVKGIPRLANFPYGEVSWTKVQGYIEKYGMEGIISWEDAMSDNIDVIARELLRIARAVAYAVDNQIFSVLYAASSVNVVAITAGYEWDSATVANRDPIQNILNAKKELMIDNFNPDKNGFICLNPKDYANLSGNSKIQNYFGKFVDASGKGYSTICNLNIIVSNVVTADVVLVAISKECGTWKQAAPLTSFTTIDKGVKYTVRAYEIGVCQATTPNALCRITNTAA